MYIFKKVCLKRTYMTFNVIACKRFELFYNKNYRICYSLLFLTLTFIFFQADSVSSIWNFLILLWNFV